MVESAQVISLVDAYAARKEALAARTQGQVLSLWQRVDPFNGGEVADFSEQASRLTVAAQNQAAFTAGAHQLNLLRLMGIDLEFSPSIPEEVRMYSKIGYEFAKPVPRRTDLGYSERLSNTEIFDRAARQSRYLQSSGKSAKEALDITSVRVKLSIDANVTLAEREADAQVINFAQKKKKNQIVGYRRVLHPERTKGGSCALCVAAANRLYQAKEQRAFHDNCKCQIIAVTREFDPGLTLNKEDLSNIYNEAGGNARDELKNLRFVIEDHGELGPILVSPAGVAITTFSATRPDLSVDVAA